MLTTIYCLPCVHYISPFIPLFTQQVAAQAGQKVHLVDIDGEAISKAEKRIADSLQRVAKKKFKVASNCSHIEQN